MSSRRGLHLPSLLQLVISGAGFLISMSAFSLFLLIGLVSLASGNAASPELLMLSSMAWISVLVAMLVLPSLLLAGRRLLNIGAGGPQTAAGKPFLSNLRIPGGGLKLAGGLMVLLPPLLLAGDHLSQNTTLAWLLLPPLSLMVIIIPVWWVYQVGSRGLGSGSAQRKWGLVSVGLVITPWVIMFVEAILVMIAVGILLLWLSSQPGFIEDLTLLSQSFMENQVDPDKMLAVLSPYLQNPVVLIGSLAMAAGLVPLLEEFLKPLGMWPLLLRRPTPQEGFTAGLICGGTFALLESLVMMASFSGEGWAMLAVGRMGTGILHSLSTALTGWGLATAREKGGYLKLAAIYLVSVTLHGLWNAVSLAMAVGTLIPAGGEQDPVLAALPAVTPMILVVVTIFLLVLLIGGNRILRRQQVTVIPG